MDERRDDWQRGVDASLVSLNRLWEREVAALHRSLSEIDAFLRGDREKDTDGAIARLHQLENSLNLLKAVILRDATGGKGLIGRVEALESGERGSDNRWKFATAVVVAILSLSGLLLTNWERLEAFLIKQRKLDPLEKMIQNAKHPRPKHRRVVVRVDPPEQESEGQ